MSVRGSGGTSGFAVWSADFGHLEGCRDGIMPVALSQVVPLTLLGDKAKKGVDLTGACSPITFPMIVGLGGTMAVVLNVLTSVPTTGDGGRFYARGLLAQPSYFRIRQSLAIEPLSIRRTPFPCSRPRPTPGPGDHAFFVGASSWSLDLFVLPLSWSFYKIFKIKPIVL